MGGLFCSGVYLFANSKTVGEGGFLEAGVVFVPIGMPMVGSGYRTQFQQLAA